MKVYTEKTRGDYCDFCPLCGFRFFGDTPDEVYEAIMRHIDDKTCENNFRSPAIALADTGKDLRQTL